VLEINYALQLVCGAFFQDAAREAVHPVQGAGEILQRPLVDDGDHCFGLFRTGGNLFDHEAGGLAGIRLALDDGDAMDERLSHPVLRQAPHPGQGGVEIAARPFCGEVFNERLL
jgi:hypothetical protein